MTPTLESSDTLIASSSSTTSSPCNDSHINATGGASGGHYVTYQHSLDTQQFAEANNNNSSASLADSCANITGSNIFGSMPILASQHQAESAFHVSETPPIQAAPTSSFTLLNSSESVVVDMTQLQSPSQQDMFAQAMTYPGSSTALPRTTGGGRVLRRRSQAAAGSIRRASSPGNPSRVHPYMPQMPGNSGASLGSSPFGGVLPPADPTAVLRRSNSVATLTPYTSVGQQAARSGGPSKPLKSPGSTFIIPAINQDGTCKRCANCCTAETPSWRRHPETQELLCNACGLYLRLHRKARPITMDESGNIQVVRKNAAIQREPINLRPTGPFGHTPPVLGVPNGSYQPYHPPHGTIGLQLISPIHPPDGISSPFSAMHMEHYSQSLPHASLHASVGEVSASDFQIGNVLQPKVLSDNKVNGDDVSGSLFSTTETSARHSPSYESSSSSTYPFPHTFE
ncbi:Sodium- and chloride-dependent GABA transporter 1 [Coemansia sp. RSA 1933]|nr:Sodium- and chloride-dependent GABA transporter 1 [Coemansia sp. RSA 1933]